MIVSERLVQYEQMNFIDKNKPPFKTTQINNRRYLGNKYRLLPFITSIVDENCSSIKSVADIFAGTGAVASAFTNKQLITNDNLYSNYICHVAWFSPQEYSRKKIEMLIVDYNNTNVVNDNYMSINFSDTFFSKTDCRKIGYVREDIEYLFSQNEINERERALLITSLLYSADKIANTCGHYDAYRQGTAFIKPFELSVPLPTENLNKTNVCYNEDSNELVKRIKADLVYIDPPYNSRQYCDAYHLLENIARWEKPDVVGVAKKMDRTKLKSDYCTSKATSAFDDLIENIDAKYIVLSYSNMAQKGNGRSNAKISDDDIMQALSQKGDVKVFTQDYKPFSTGKSDISEHQERIFLCTKRQVKKHFIKSPLNYTGGKYKLLPQILPHFPKQIDTFIDLFCGGCDVGINVNASQIILNDSNSRLYGIFNTFRSLGKDTILAMVDEIINNYSLSQSSTNGYSFYNCNSSSGLGEYNREPFLKMREDFNKKNLNYSYDIILYTLIVFAFNNQLRFNSKGEFNLPVGKRDFNDKMKAKLSVFIDCIQKKNYLITNEDFRNIDFSNLTENSLVYCDPPYLITCATYNEQNGWNEQCDNDLYDLLDSLNEKNIRFALSNVLSNNSKTNAILSGWLAKRSYRTIHLSHSYSNSNYQKKSKSSITDEVLVLNF